MDEQEKITDAEWLRLQRLESERKAWLWRRLGSLAGWIGGTFVFLSEGIDVIHKLTEWWHRK